MTDTHFMKAYTIKEVSKKINVPSGTIRQWEKDLAGLLFVPRTKQGARFYTEIEISLLLKIKQMRDKNLSKEMIRDLLHMHVSTDSQPSSEEFGTSQELSIEPLSHLPSSSEKGEGYEAFMAAMEQYKQNLLQEVKAEISNGIRKEVLEEIKKEVSKGTFTTVRTISDCIYKSGEKTAEQIKELAENVVMTSEHHSEALGAISSELDRKSVV